MRRALTIGLAIAAVGISVSYVAARSFRNESARERGLQPVSAIVTTVREMGLAPNSRVLRRGGYYILHALDPHGVELRVVADAYFGDILSVRPAQPYSLTPDYVRGPLIIHVPQPDDEQADIGPDGYDGSDGAARGDENVAPVAPAPPLRSVRPRYRAEAPVPPPPRRAVRSAPPSDALLTPVYPTPKFGSRTGAGKAEADEKFEPPQNATTATMPPPIGYTPPSALPRQ